MVFSSLLFLVRFLPIVLILYYISPRKYRNFVLFVSSLFFYAWGEPVYVTLILFSSVVDYIAGRMVGYYKQLGSKKGQKIAVLCSATINLSLLFVFKYADFFISLVDHVPSINIAPLNLALPIGISFYTFQTMSYTIDVYRGEAKVQKNFITFGAYVALFPQLIAGPIVRYQTVAEQMDSRKETLDLFKQGVLRFVVGLGKKVLIANQVGALWNEIAQTKVNMLTTSQAWLGAVAFTLQIYFDFSGYSDMAIGLGKIFGFDFPENFNYPYISKSITEFWRRWHMSLGTWFRDYVYIPMGGNRVKKWRWFLNILVVWALTGLWHGAAWNFVIWGLYMAFFLILEKLFLLPLLKKSRAAGHIYTMLLVMISFVIFSAATMSDAGAVIAGMFGAGGLSTVSAESLYYLKSYAITLIIAIAGSLPVVRNVFAGLEGRMKDNKAVNAVFTIGEPVVLAALLILVTGYLVDGSFNPFLYFRF